METVPWNWLEILKLASSFFTPVILAIFGIYIHRITKKFELIQWRSQKLVEKRLAIYDDIAPLLNDLLCYFTYVGSWKDLTPPDVIQMKRILDKKMHLAAPLFSKSFFSSCMTFQNLCFETFTGWGRDALLRTQWKRRQEALEDSWKSDWNQLFSISTSDPKEIRKSYAKIMEAFATDIGVHPTFIIPPSGRIPANIK